MAAFAKSWRPAGVAKCHRHPTGGSDVAQIRNLRRDRPYKMQWNQWSLQLCCGWNRPKRAKSCNSKTQPTS